MRLVTMAEPLAERDLSDIVGWIAEEDKRAPFQLNSRESGYLETERLMAAIVMGLHRVGRDDLIDDTPWFRGVIQHYNKE